MRIGLFGNKAYSMAAKGPFDLEELVAEAASAREDGLSSYWVGQQFDWDAFCLLAVLAREVPDVELGVNVTHVWTAFPAHMAQQARSVDFVSDGRFTLGLGVEHEWPMRQLWGLPFERPVSTLAEYLEVVSGLVHDGFVEFAGELYNVNSFFPRFSPAPDLPIVLGALGPRMLRLAATRADGTSTWLTGLKTIQDHIVPTIRAAAEDAGRPEPRVIACMPMCCTSRPHDEVRAEISEQMDIYHRMPSYQAMLEREGVAAAGQIGFVGSRDQVEEQMGLLREAGATDLAAIVFGTPDEEAETRDLLRAAAARPEAAAAGGKVPPGSRARAHSAG